MTAISAEQARTQLNLWIQADAKVAAGQEVEMDGMKLTRADAAVISEKIDYWSRRYNQAKRGGGIGVFYVRG